MGNRRDSLKQSKAVHSSTESTKIKEDDNKETGEAGNKPEGI